MRLRQILSLLAFRHYGYTPTISLTKAWDVLNHAQFVSYFPHHCQHLELVFCRTIYAQYGLDFCTCSSSDNMYHDMDEYALGIEEFLDELNDSERKNAPKQLYIAGNSDLLRGGRRVSVVGTRNVSQAGIERTQSIIKELVDQDIIVVSGLAAGVDTAAHRAAIEHSGNTVAVIGTPLDKFYPAENATLQRKLMADYAVVSQFAIGCPVTPKNFPMRNRTMALLTDATIIVEAGEKSGTRHQGWEALRLGRDVFILDNIVENGCPSWVEEMIRYGAQPLAQQNLPFVLKELPAYTDRVGADTFDF